MAAEAPGQEPPRRSDPATPGELLRAARLRRRVSLAEAEQATRIRAQYLQALEDDDLGALPAGVYSRGFLRNYAIFLGVPPDDVLKGVRDRRVRDSRSPLRSPARPVTFRIPRAAWLFALLGLGAVLVVAVLAWLGLTAPEEQRAAPPVAAVSPTTLVQLPPLATSAPATALPTALAAAQPTVAASPTASKTLDVELRTTDRTWVRATVDGKVVLEETLPAGQVQRWSGQQSVLLRVGNAGGVDVTANGQRVGALGPAGTAVDREFTK